MNWQYALFDLHGRISQATYWRCVLILFAGNVILPMIPVLGWIASVVMIWCGVAIYGKRLHDAGKSAWLHAAPWGINIALMIAAFMLFGAGIVILMAENQNGGEPSATTLATFFGAMGGAVVFLAAGSLVWLGYTVWVGVAEPDPNENVYGPPVRS